MSIPELTLKLAEIKEQIAIRDKMRRDSERVQKSLEAELAKLRSLAGGLRKETRDVERLEGLSLEALFYTILGSKEEQLDKERQEQLAAKLKHDQSRHAADALAQDLAELRQRLGGLGGIDEQYTSLLKEKETALLQTNTVETQRLLELAERTGALRASSKELSEATAAGLSVGSSLDNVLNSLASAGNWGTWDLLGGGLIATHMKHSHLDEARGSVHEAQVRAARFERESADVSLDVDVALQFSGFTRFADYFFDNLITDWIVNSRIEQSRNTASSAKARVASVVTQLQKRLNDVKRELDAVAAERRALIEHA